MAVDELAEKVLVYRLIQIYGKYSIYSFAVKTRNVLKAVEAV